MQAARQLLLSLFDHGLGGRGQQQRRGGGGGGRDSQQTFSGSRTREGEWRCGCGFPTNRAHRTACYACGAPRGSAEAARAPGSKGGGRNSAGGGKGQGLGGAREVGGVGRGDGGPVGAYGNRPLLGQGAGIQGDRVAGGQGKSGGGKPAWDGRGPTVAEGLGRAPTKGKGAAAKGADAGPKGSGGGCDGKGSASGVWGQGERRWVKPARVVDGDAFELVQPRRIRAAKGGGGKGDDGGGEGDSAAVRQTGAATTTTGVCAARRLWSDELSDDDDAMEDGGDDDGEELDGDERVEETSDPQQLRAAYEEHARAVRDLERKGGFGPALETLRRARDGAEQAWREAKAPAPLPKRLAWAESKLQRAQAALTRERLALDAFDEEVEAERERRCAKVREAEEWLHWRQRQLEELHAEVGGRAQQAGGLHGNGAGAEVRRKLRGHVLPELQAILEEMQDGSALHERLTLVAAGVADAERHLDDGDTCDGVQRFDLSDDHPWDEGWGDGDGDADDDGDGLRARSGQGGTGGSCRPAGWRPEGNGRWSRKGPGGPGDESCSGQGDSARDGAGTPARSGTEPSATPGAGGTTGVGNGTGGDISNGVGSGRVPVGPTEDGGTDVGQQGERSAKLRKCQSEAEAREEADAKAARELHQQIQQAAAAQQQSFEAGHGGFGSDIALSVAAQQFVLQVQAVQAKAQAKGIEPRAGGRDLLQLTPLELQAWVSENNLDEGGASAP